MSRWFITTWNPKQPCINPFGMLQCWHGCFLKKFTIKIHSCKLIAIHFKIYKWFFQLDDSQSLHRKWLFHQTSIYKWLFQLDDSQSLHRKWLFHQTSIYKWLFQLDDSQSLHRKWLFHQTSIYKWLFQLDDSQSLHRKWLFHQTSIYKWLFRVPGTQSKNKSSSNLGTYYPPPRFWRVPVQYSHFFRVVEAGPVGPLNSAIFRSSDR